MFRSATLKLTLWYVALSMGLSLVFSGVLYRFGTHELAEGLNNQYREIVANDHDADDRSTVTGHELDARSSSLLEELIYFNIFVLVGATGASYILARRTLKPIEVAHEQQLRFTAEASHELRTPLTAMKADTEATLMQKNADAPTLRETLEGNMRDIARLEDLSNHLLELARYQTKNDKPLTVIAFAPIINNAVKQYRRRISESHLDVSTTLEQASVSGDGSGITRLVTIILDNAIKYSRDGGSIEISLLRQGTMAVLKIQDDGVGIHPSDLPHVFERFYRSHHDSTSQNGVSGYGLGLPLAKEIVSFHNGSIDIQSKQSRGTSVVIRLPIAHNH